MPYFIILLYYIKILDNTFVGTLLAGGLLALFGLFLYRRQKQIDVNYDEFRKIRDLASVLFVCLETANSDYSALLNIINKNSSPQIAALKDRIIQLGGNPFDGYDKLFNSHISEINRASKSLIAQLNFYEYKGIEILNENIPKLNFYLSVIPIFINSKSFDTISNFKENFENYRTLIENKLKEIIKGEKIRKIF